MHIFAEKKSFNAQVCQWTGKDLPAPVFVFAQVSSVLDVAWELVAQSQLPEWGSVLAESQSKGRGQMRRSWHSPAGNIYAALRLPATEPFTTTAAAPALSSCLINVLRALQCPLYLKWPNDLAHIHCAGRPQKVGGILLEERQGVILAGIGLNVMYAPPDDSLRENYALAAGILPSPMGLDERVTLVNNSGFSYENSVTERLWIYVVNQLYFCYEAKLHLAWLDTAHASLLWKDKYVQVEDGRESIGGILQGLNAHGELCLSIQGATQCFNGGSVRLANEKFSGDL